MIYVNQVLFYKLDSGKEPVADWLDSLDSALRRRVKKRIDSLERGLFGDIKRLSADVFELSLHFGSGYRIYGKNVESNVIILLCAGSKASQSKDIVLAKRYSAAIEGQWCYEE